MTTDSTALLVESIDALERIGCQFTHCDGPTLEPVDMVTCFACALLARLRVAVGRPARRPDEMTADEAWHDWNRRYVAAATGGNR
jgi:hypothetical protein